MDLSLIDILSSSFGQFCHFLFETYVGIGLLIGTTLLATLIIAAILEIKTRNKYKNHPIGEDIDNVKERD